VARALVPAASPPMGTIVGRVQCQWWRRVFEAARHSCGSFRTRTRAGISSGRRNLRRGLRLVFRNRIGVGWGMRGFRLGLGCQFRKGCCLPKRRARGSRCHPPAHIRESHFAFAAVTAPQALLTEVVVTRVLGATGADPSRFFFANTAGEWHETNYFFRTGLGGAAWVTIARQRCASWSITSKSRSLCPANSTM